MSTYESTLLLCAAMGWGLATSPLPLAALGAMLLGSKNPGKSSAAFTGAWFVFQVIALVVIAPIVASVLSIHLGPTAKEVTGWAGCMLGVLIGCWAIVVYLRGRRNPSTTTADRTARVLDEAGSAGVKRAVWLAFFFSILNPTNISYWAATALFLSRSGLPSLERIEIIVITALVASSTFVLVTILVLTFREQSTKWLTKVRDLVLKHSGSIVPGLLFTVAVLLIAVGTKDLSLW